MRESSSLVNREIITLLFSVRSISFLFIKFSSKFRAGVYDIAVDIAKQMRPQRSLSQRGFDTKQTSSPKSQMQTPLMVPKSSIYYFVITPCCVF